jgi:hypothetical protein
MRIQTVFAAAVLLVAPSVKLEAQNATAPRRVPVTVAVADRLPQQGATSIIMRRPPGTQGDSLQADVIVMLAAAADEQVLSRAIRDLLSIRQSFGDTPTIHQTLRVRPNAATAERKSQPLPWAAMLIEDLRVANRINIEGIGLSRAVTIWLPPRHQPH